MQINLIDLEIFWNYSLFRFFIDNKKEYIFFNRAFILSFISKLKAIMKKIEKINDISLYEKARTVYTLFLIISMGKKYLVNKLTDMKGLNLRFLVTSKAKKNSIIDRCHKFYHEFINSITEDSNIFQNLLYIVGGYGYYKKEYVYTFDLKNLDMIKSHFKRVFPKVIFLCYIKNGEESMTESEFGGIIP